MARPKKEGRDDSDEISPRYKHARRLAQEAREVADSREVVSEEIETVYDSRGKAKKRQVITMANGNKYRRYINERTG